MNLIRIPPGNTRLFHHEPEKHQPGKATRQPPEHQGVLSERSALRTGFPVKGFEQNAASRRPDTICKDCTPDSQNICCPYKQPICRPVRPRARFNIPCGTQGGISNQATRMIGSVLELISLREVRDRFPPQLSTPVSTVHQSLQTPPDPRRVLTRKTT